MESVSSLPAADDTHEVLRPLLPTAARCIERHNGLNDPDLPGSLSHFRTFRATSLEQDHWREVTRALFLEPAHPFAREVSRLWLESHPELAAAWGDPLTAGATPFSHEAAGDAADRLAVTGTTLWCLGIDHPTRRVVFMVVASAVADLARHAGHLPAKHQPEVGTQFRSAQRVLKKDARDARSERDRMQEDLKQARKQAAAAQKEVASLTRQVAGHKTERDRAQEELAKRQRERDLANALLKKQGAQLDAVRVERRRGKEQAETLIRANRGLMAKVEEMKAEVTQLRDDVRARSGIKETRTVMPLPRGLPRTEPKLVSKAVEQFAKKRVVTLPRPTSWSGRTVKAPVRARDALTIHCRNCDKVSFLTREAAKAVRPKMGVYKCPWGDDYHRRSKVSRRRLEGA